MVHGTWEIDHQEHVRGRSKTSEMKRVRFESKTGSHDTDTDTDTDTGP